MTPMLEKIARAITNALEEVNPNAHSTFSEDEAEACVRAALLAMREFPDDQVEKKVTCGGAVWIEGGFDLVWSSAIDTILGEKPA